MSKKITTFAAFIVVSCGHTAFADPITLVYNIQITHRCRPNDCGPFSGPAFPLRMTFDSGVTERFDSLTQHAQFYGPPTFSAVPLERPAIPTTASNLSFTLELAAQFDNGWLHRAAAEELFRVVTPELFTDWSLLLIKSEEALSSPPPLSAQIMAAFLGAPATLDATLFSYSYIAFGINREFDDFISYGGVASLAEQQSPVPEPTTLVLAGAALAATWHRQRRRFAAPDRRGDVLGRDLTTLD